MASAGGIVLESYTGDKPPNADQLLKPIVEELALRGYSGGTTTADRFEATVSRPAFGEQRLPVDFAAQVERGYQEWINGNFTSAANALGPLVDLGHANPGAFAQTPALREAMKKAMIALALSQERKGDPNARNKTFAALLLDFREEAQVPRGTYGAEAAKLFEQVKREVAAAGRGTVVLSVRPEAALYLNEKFEQVGEVRADVIAGEYRALAQVGASKPTRSHRVVVQPGQRTTVTIDAAFDFAVRTTPKLTGFSFRSDAERERDEATFARMFAVAIEAPSVAVIGIGVVRGRTAIVGALINLNDDASIRAASVEIGASVEERKGLARFLAGEDPIKGVEVRKVQPARVPAGMANGNGAINAAASPVGEPGDAGAGGSAGRGLWRGWKYIAGGAALVGFGLGGTLLVLDGNCKTGDQVPCPDVYTTAGQGWLAVGGGAALAAASVYLFVRGDRRPARAAYVVPARGGVVAGVAARF